MSDIVRCSAACSRCDKVSRGWLGARGTRHGSGRDTGTDGDGDEDEDGDEGEDAYEEAEGDRTWMGMIDRLSHAGLVVGGTPRDIPSRHALRVCANYGQG